LAAAAALATIATIACGCGCHIYTESSGGVSRLLKQSAAHAPIRHSSICPICPRAATCTSNARSFTPHSDACSRTLHAIINLLSFLDIHYDFPHQISARHSPFAAIRRRPCSHRLAFLCRRVSGMRRHIFVSLTPRTYCVLRTRFCRLQFPAFNTFQRAIFGSVMREHEQTQVREHLRRSFTLLDADSWSRAGVRHRILPLRCPFLQLLLCPLNHRAGCAGPRFVCPCFPALFFTAFNRVDC